MGLLDDAIRDHLELRRQHGADPGDVARQEREALGPVRRDAPAPAADAAADEYEPLPGDEVAETTDEEEPVYDDDLLGEEDESPADDADRPRGAVSSSKAAEDDDGDDEPLAEVDQPTAAYDLEELRGAQRAGAEPDVPAPRPADAGDERGGAGSRDVVAADDEPEGDDVLEETPEFLQETPEHDRLWFEQKPPRDFDF